MKRTLGTLSFLIALAISTFAQNNAKWSLGVGVNPQWDGIMVSLYLNHHVNNHVEIGLMPVYRHESSKHSQFSTREDFLGINFNSRLYIITNHNFAPYIYAFGGYIREYRNITDLSGSYDSRYNHYDLSFGGGTKISFGNTSWSIDLNLGYVKLFRPETLWDLESHIYSFGIIKSIN